MPRKKIERQKSGNRLNKKEKLRLIDIKEKTKPFISNESVADIISAETGKSISKQGVGYILKNKLWFKICTVKIHTIKFILVWKKLIL